MKLVHSYLHLLDCSDISLVSTIGFCMENLEGEVTVGSVESEEVGETSREELEDDEDEEEDVS